MEERMRRSRRNGGHAGLEFGGSGEDSFVAVVVTKLTGALLFILLLTMVIMALLPKAVDLPSSEQNGGADDAPPWRSPRPERSPRRSPAGPMSSPWRRRGAWAAPMVGRRTVPDGLSFDPEPAILEGTPAQGDPGAGRPGAPRQRRPDRAAPGRRRWSFTSRTAR